MAFNAFVRNLLFVKLKLLYISKLFENYFENFPEISRIFFMILINYIILGKNGIRLSNLSVLQIFSYPQSCKNYMKK